MNQIPGNEYLQSNGINFFHSFDTLDVADLLTPAVADIDLDEFPSTVLIANAGRKLWDALQDFGMRDSDPVDTFSEHIATTYATEQLNTTVKILYPSSYPVPLREFGARTGSVHTSLIGIGIHPHFGTWFAYRALFLVGIQLPASVQPKSEHPCEICPDMPCRAVCPPMVVKDPGLFDLDGCARFRLQEQSPCASSCFSRIRCPVGTEFRYAPRQMKYHYDRSRRSMARYYSELKDSRRN